MDALTIPLFPLNTVLFPGGQLRLKIFEQRYLDMTKRCIADTMGFGVIAAFPAQGSDVEIASVGTIAIINQWDMPHTGIFDLQTSGATRFLIEERWTEKDGLNVARVREIPNEPDITMPAESAALATLLESLIEKYGADKFPSPVRVESASWVSMRLAEVIPISLKLRHQMLEINDAALRLKAVAQFLASQNIKT
jgi:uncharacterized protein